MADRGMLAFKDEDSASMSTDMAESQGSNGERLNADDHCDQDQEHSSRDWV